MKPFAFASLCLLLPASALLADVSLTDKGATMRAMTRNANALTTIHKLSTPLTPAEKAALRAANLAKRQAKHARHGHGGSRIVPSAIRITKNATGSVQLIDAAGLKYFINTNITFSTSSSASGAASEASYTHSIVASTSGGGTTMSSLSDMFDGYNAMCVSLTNATGPCQTGNANYTMYNQNGPASIDATVPAGPTCTNRQYVYPAKAIGGLSVSRKVFVPTNDRFIRWMNFFTNTTGAPITFTMITSNNLGSDSNTIITGSSSGDNAAQTNDLWVATFQNFSGSTSSDPRIGHVLQGTGAPTPVSNIFFANGDDNPYWAYSITLAAGQTKAIVNYATGQGTKAAAAAQAAAIAAYGANEQQCMSATELSQVVNFAGNADLAITKTANFATAFGGHPISYNLAVTNNGPGTATSVSVSDTLPAGSGFVSATGTGWTCNNVAGVVTCTAPSLPVGAAPSITLTITAPPVVSAGTLSNTATISAASSDPTPANNSSTAVAPILPGSAIPAMSGWMLALLGMALAGVATILLGRHS
jgi:uncharacterized repeat protein (TIGR01451 family)